MKKHRISTTISPKHWAMLKKYTDKYESQQKTLELALESLENNSKQSPPLSKEEEVWMQIYGEIKDLLMIFQKSTARLVLETVDIERFREHVTNHKPVELAIEYYYKKTLKACSLQEIIDGIILNLKIQGSASVVNYTDEGDYYAINITHNMGLNMGHMLVIEHESLFKSYGVKAESHFSELSVFFKIYKTAG